MRTKLSNGWTNRYALLALVAWAPLALGAKGCDHAIVGEDGHAGRCTSDCPSGEGGAETGGTSGGAGKGGNAGKGGAAGNGGGQASGGSSGTGATAATGGSSGSGQAGSGGSVICGGFGGVACDKGQYCNFPLGAMCGAADQAGTCQPIPDACDTLYDPVCGCDGKTYGNTCEAALAGVAVSATGACATGGTPCGGTTGAHCDGNTFCHFSIETMCGSGDQPGTCDPIPESCDAVFQQPVCGCDGMAYPTECAANMAGVSAAADGACAPGATCGGITGATCPAGQFCNFPVETNCGTSDQTGTCAPTMGFGCSDIYAPVCGCDGKTYPTACDAQMAGVSVAAQGECATGSGTTCGGITGAQCPDGQYCDFPTGTNCGSGDQTGTCKTTMVVCPEVTGTPLVVCACDGRQYSNACLAQQAGVSIVSAGTCGLK
jgi:hypothetical protein